MAPVSKESNDRTIGSLEAIEAVAKVERIFPTLIIRCVSTKAQRRPAHELFKLANEDCSFPKRLDRP
jgi:hypothetical protein